MPLPDRLSDSRVTLFANDVDADAAMFESPSEAAEAVRETRWRAGDAAYEVDELSERKWR